VLDVATREKASLDPAYKTALGLLTDSYNSRKIFLNISRTVTQLSCFEPLCIPAMQPAARKEAINQYLNNGEIFDITAIGIFAWAIINVLNDYNAGERVIFEKYFTKCEEYLDSKINVDGLFPTGAEGNWLKSADRQGILIENQAYYGKILDILFLLTNDDVYEFKKNRLIRAMRDKLDGAYVLDREDTLEIRPNNFITSFFAPELFTYDEWVKTFDASLKDDGLWLNWGGFTTLGKSDPSYNEERDGESWFFVNNIAGIVLHRLNSEKYTGKIQKILSASAENILWQKHSGRPCEVTLTADGKMQVQGLYGLSLATFIYLYRITQNI